MADVNNVDRVNIKDPTLFTEETLDLSNVEFYSRKGNVNRKILGDVVANLAAQQNDLGTFTGGILTNNTNTKAALQELSDAIEGISSSDDVYAKVSSGDTTAGYLESKIVAGANVTITKLNTGGNEQLSIAAASGGGSGGHIIEDEGTPLTNRDTINFVGTGVTVTDGGTKTVVTIPGSTGEANTASNLGSGNGVFSSKSGVDLRFKSLLAGTGIALSSDSNSITIINTGSGGGGGGVEVYDSGEGVWVAASAAGVTTLEGSQGTYTIAVPNGVYLFSFWKNVTNANELTIGGEILFTVSWIGSSFNASFSDAMVPWISLVDSGGTQRNPGDVAVTVQHTSVASGSTNTTIANINGLGIPVRVKGVVL